MFSYLTNTIQFLEQSGRRVEFSKDITTSLLLVLSLPLLDLLLLTLLLVTDWLTKQGPSCRIRLLEKLTFSQQLKIFPTFYET